MAWRIVNQPNGLLARFSDVVENFTHMNMTDEQAIDVCLDYMGRRDAAEKVRIGRADGIVGYGVFDFPPATDGLARWRDCLDTILFRHGEDAALEVARIGALDHGVMNDTRS